MDEIRQLDVFPFVTAGFMPSLASEKADYLVTAAGTDFQYHLMFWNGSNVHRSATAILDVHETCLFHS